jgi:carboxylesterase type B
MVDEKNRKGLLICFRIRYAAPPVGNLRFAAPQAPARNRTTTAALADPPICPQTGASLETPAAYGFTSALGNEDCLFLNVYAPANAKNLPVFFWIRKATYGALWVFRLTQ